MNHVLKPTQKQARRDCPVTSGLATDLKRTALASTLALVLGGCSTTDATSGGSLEVIVSGESLAFSGYQFPATPGQEVAFVDGWSVSFDKVLVVLDEVWLSEMPDKSSTNQALMGSRVASLKGPWVADLAATGTGSVAGRNGGGERAWPLGTIDHPNESGADSFDPSQRYALSFSFATATKSVKFLGLKSTDPDWLDMLRQGYSHLFVGTAQFRGSQCRTTNPAYDFATLPTTVRFRLGFREPVISDNCQNSELTGTPLGGEEFQRGVQIPEGKQGQLQVTLHTDHLFWTTTQHDAGVPHFDHFAARARVQGPRAELELGDLERAPAPRLLDLKAKELPWRSCVPETEYILPLAPSTVTLDTSDATITSLAAFVRQNARTMGHMNADGLCYVRSKDASR